MTSISQNEKAYENVGETNTQGICIWQEKYIEQ